MTQVETTKPAATAPPQSPPGLVDVKIDKPRAIRASFVIPAAVGGFFAVALLLFIAQALNVFTAYAALGVIGVMAVIAVVLEVRRNRRKREREFRRLLAEKRPAEAAAFLALHLPDEGPNKFMINLMSELSAHRSEISALRVHWTVDLAAIEPLRVNFTTASLNESDEQFIQLAEATAAEPVPQDSSGAGLQVTPEESAMGRLVRRNLRLNGGWVVLCVFGFNFVLSAIEAFMRWRLTIGVFIWPLGCFLYLFLSPTAGPLVAKEWLIVPGGMVLRKQGRDRTKSDLELFSPGNSILLALQTRKEAWSVFITDGNRKETVILTMREVDMLLRAWLSPIPPPSVEKLVDLT